MPDRETADLYAAGQRLSRRAFLRFCAATASILALPAGVVRIYADNLRHAPRRPVIWLSFQECTACTESLTRSHAPTLEDLLFDHLSLDYHHTLQAACGEAAEAARQETIERFTGRYLLIVDGSIPMGAGGAYSTIAGRTNLDILAESAAHAAAVIAIGTCAAFGGLAGAAPNPTGAVAVSELMRDGLIADRPLVNLPGCPPLPLAISGVLAHLLAFERLPALDALRRPLAIYGNTVHERCSRYHFYQQERFAEHFDDEGARKGWCLYKLGCKGPVTRNACALHKWNEGTSFPVEAGHPCIGCAEPGFWDKGGFYRDLDELTLAYRPSAEPPDSAIAEGRRLYDQHCTYCHEVDASDLKTPAEDVPDLLRSSDIRSHQSLQFSDDQLSVLGRYLATKK